jgi:hypothetical protein
LLWQQIIDGFARTSAAATKTLTGQHAAIVATVVTTLIGRGNYRLSYYLRKTIADGVASSAQVTLGSPIEDGAAEPFAALVTDSVTAHASGSILVRADNASNVLLDVAYVSNTPGTMNFDSRLVGTELEAVWPHLPPSACVIVVEDDGGAIAGCWCCFTSVHAEGVWIAPWHRRSRTVIARQLMAAMAEQLEALGAAAFVTGAVSAGVRAIIRKLGGPRFPVSST